MDLFQRASELYAAGKMHDAFEAAQAACDRAPKDADAWWLLGRIGRHTGMPAASDDAFRRAVELNHSLPLPFRLSPERFHALLAEAREALSPEAARRLEHTTIRVQAIPTTDQVTAGIDPDALTLRERTPHDVLVLFQVNHENCSGSEEALRALVGRSVSRA